MNSIFSSLLMVFFLHGEVSAQQHSSSAQKEKSEHLQHIGVRNTSNKPLKLSYTTIASYYGGEKGSHDFHGKPMKNGEKFNKFDPTIAASNKLPLGTIIRVTNLENQRTQELVVKDTGRFDEYGRGIDVSRAAAQKLGFLEEGLVRVRIKVISFPSST